MGRSCWMVVGLWALCAQAAWGATRFGSEHLTAAELAKMPLPLVKAYVRERIAEQRQRGERTGIDSELPVLTRVSVVPQVTAGGAALVDIHASDRVSGIMRVGVFGGTFDRWVSIGHDFPAPQWSLRETLSEEVSPYARPGPVTLSYVYLEDAAGNFAEYEGDALVGMGQLQTTVINPQGGDSTPPELVGGLIETPRISQSRNSPGTDRARYVRVTLTVRDLGNPQVSGPRLSYLQFCTLDSSSCFWLRSDWPGPGVSLATLHFGGQVRREDVRPGLHYLRAVELGDRAYIDRTYTSLRFPDGTDDLSVFFPQGDSILVKP